MYPGRWCTNTVANETTGKQTSDWSKDSVDMRVAAVQSIENLGRDARRERQCNDSKV
jgi:hypothetical protein